MIRTFAAFVVAALAAGTASADSYKLTGENTTVTFVGSKPDGKHSGGFKTLAGTAEVADGALTGLEVTIQCDSIHSDDAKLTGHLKSPDFFNVKEHGTAVVKVTKVLGRDPASVDPKRTQDQYAQAWGKAEMDAYSKALRERFKVKIKTVAVDASVAASGASAK